MHREGRIVLAFALVCPVSPAFADVSLSVLGTFSSGPANEAGSEIATHDPVTQRLFTTNGADVRIDIIDVADPANPVLIASIDTTAEGRPTSVAFKNGLGAASIASDPVQDPGTVIFFDADGQRLGTVTAGALPDMVTFTPDGTKLLVANEGEPNGDYTVDPEGSISIIDVSGGPGSATVATAGFGAFNALEDDLRDAGVRIYGPGASAAQDFEPEFIVVSSDSTTAWASLQENNALAVIDIASATVTDILPLGFKNHRLAGNGLDASDEDGDINIQPWPVLGMYLPDGLAIYSAGGETYIVTANEGDTRDYDGFSEEERIGDLRLGSSVIAGLPGSQSPKKLGRLKVTNAPPDGIVTLGNKTTYTKLYTFGARSFGIWNATTGELVFDSGDSLEQATAECPVFNSDNAENDSCDSRSDDKGPEPEYVAVGAVGGSTYAFVGLERTSAIAVYDVSDPTSPTLVDVAANRDFEVEDLALAGDLGPEGLLFISGDDSPNGLPILVVANEVSGTTTLWQVNED